MYYMPLINKGENGSKFEPDLLSIYPFISFICYDCLTQSVGILEPRTTHYSPDKTNKEISINDLIGNYERFLRRWAL